MIKAIKWLWLIFFEAICGKWNKHQNTSDKLSPKKSCVIKLLPIYRSSRFRVTLAFISSWFLATNGCRFDTNSLWRSVLASTTHWRRHLVPQTLNPPLFSGQLLPFAGVWWLVHGNTIMINLENIDEWSFEMAATCLPTSWGTVLWQGPESSYLLVNYKGW